MDEENAVWVLSETAPDGTYVCAVHFSEDRAIVLDRNAALRYVATVCDAAARAEYDAAVFAQMTKVRGLTERDVAEMIVSMRQDRPALDAAATKPVEFVPIFAMRSRKPLIHVFLDGEVLTEWTPAEARGHAMHVLNALVVADLDHVYRGHLVAAIGVTDAQARTIVDRLIQYRGAIESAPNNDSA